MYTQNTTGMFYCVNNASLLQARSISYRKPMDSGSSVNELHPERVKVSS
jgi:hypothetical protein